jgi:hypothetical protein
MERSVAYFYSGHNNLSKLSTIVSQKKPTFCPRYAFLRVALFGLTAPRLSQAQSHNVFDEQTRVFRIDAADMTSPFNERKQRRRFIG